MSTPAPSPTDSTLSLPKMLQIRDVARAIRDEPRTVEQLFPIEETRAKIRERLSVTPWRERVPKEVYDHIKADKVSDGVLHETRFAEKVRGALSERGLLLGADGQPRSRGPRITQW